MGSKSTGESFIDSMLGKVLRRKPAEPQAAPLNTPLGMLERLHAGEQPDYCLYLRPRGGGPVVKSSPLSVDLEELLIKAFDPLPFMFLNLFLSTLAALQAPIIMMSQNRQATKDKALAVNDFQVNLKNEVSIDKLLRGQGELILRLGQLEHKIAALAPRSGAL